VHKQRNIARKVRRSSKKACLEGVKLIYLAPNRREAVKRFQAWRDKWIGNRTKGSCMSRGIH
jgi:transposase-like protein